MARDEEHYAQAFQEVKAGNIDENLFVKALVLSGGDHEAAKFEYVKLRVEQIKSDQIRNIPGNIAYAIREARSERKNRLNSKKQLRLEIKAKKEEDERRANEEWRTAEAKRIEDIKRSEEARRIENAKRHAEFDSESDDENSTGFILTLIFFVIIMMTLWYFS